MGKLISTHTGARWTEIDSSRSEDATDTPAGVGALHDPRVFIKAGDVIEIRDEGIGIPRIPIVADQGRS